ncbi:RNA-binding protein 43-like isoform X3 [Rhincodon typus]|uniref:RNA-binding protein 43-like isoform X3 n=1 Tax=Rhincodon typus TaxID=259920 RepID=UPI002030C422|nr:RNA-binding protein 43-like isoform X3 [Rhincodon typus]
MAVPRALEGMESNLAERTIAVSGFPEDVLPINVMIDKLTIHFLRPKNGGGEVEFVSYPTSDPGIAYIIFEKEEVVNSVLRKKEQVLEDKQLPKKYPLQVSQSYIFTKVSVDLDLSIFGETTNIVRELESRNKSLQFSACPDGRFRVAGSFSAMKDLRKDVQRRINDFQIFHLPSSVSKSGVNTSERKLTRCASEGETKQQKPAAELSDRVNDVLCPNVLENETTVILDADIFAYINAFYKDQCKIMLCKHNAKVEVVNFDGITILQLVKASDQCEQSQLMMAKFAMESLVSQMQQTLLSEKIRLDGGSGPEKMLEACRQTMQSFPEVLVCFTDEYVSLIGNSHHCSQFKKEVNEKVKAMQSKSNVVFSGHSSIPSASGHPHHFGAGLDSSAARGKYVSNTGASSLKQNCDSGQYTSSHADRSQTGYRNFDTNGKLGSFHCGGGALHSGPSSLPASFSMASSTKQHSKLENASKISKQ